MIYKVSVRATDSIEGPHDPIDNDVRELLAGELATKIVHHLRLVETPEPFGVMRYTVEVDINDLQAYVV